MQRIGIFAFYDAEGIVDEYIDKLLCDVKKIVTKLYIVVNGKLTPESRKILKKYTEDIIIRENYGYDGGAYKNVILDYFSPEDWIRFDEVVLFNNTFYGPFFDMGDIFDMFSRNKAIDFWGLTKWIGGESPLLHEKNLPEHIQAYFVVIKKSILQSGYWLDFWKNMGYPSTYVNAIRNFEVGFTTYFFERGFRYTTWLEEQGGDQLLELGRVVYNEHPYKMISEYKFPVLKYKAITFFKSSQIAKIKGFIKKTYDYDMDLILEHLKRVQKNKNSTPFSSTALEEFYNKYDKIYVFGYGKCGKEMEAYFQYHGWNIYAFVISDNLLDGTMLSLKDVDLNTKDGIIIALGKKNYEEMEPILKNKFPEEQMLKPIYKSGNV